MAGGLNKVMLLGDLASEPEIYVTRGGMVVMSLRLATNETYTDKEDVRREKTSYHPIVVFGRRADALSKVLHRGARVFVEGSLRTSTFESRDGKKWSKTEIVANDVLFAGERAESADPPSLFADHG